MRLRKLLIGSLSAAVLLLVGFAGVANAHSFQAGTNVVVDSSQPLQQSLFVAGNNVEVKNEVFGDVFCAGQNVTISGKVHGDIICAGQTINVTSDVDGDVRLAGQNVTLNGNVKGNASIGGQTFNLGSNANVGGDLSVGSSDANLNGVIGRDLAAGGQTITVAGTVTRNITGQIGTLRLADNAKVNGNIDFTSNNDVNKSSNAIVGGTIKRTDMPKGTERNYQDRGRFSLGWFVYCLLAMLLIALALVLAFPRLLNSVTDQAVPTPWKALLTGFVASLAIPVVMIVFAITVVGLPLSLVIGLIWLLILVMSGPVFGYYLGRLILRDSRQPVLIMLAGASALLVLYFIPIIGFLAVLAAMWIGSGMLLLELFRRSPRPSYTFAAAPTRTTKKK